MREILFRGKIINGAEWLEGYFCYSSISDLPCIQDKATHEYKNVIPETVGQYTGLTDKNGNKIFEGDIVKDNTLPITCGVGVIEFGNYETKMNSSLINDNYSYHIGFYITWDDTLDFREDLAFWNEKIEVIGNIHDNPELLKEADNE